MAVHEIDLVFLIADLSGYTALTEAHGNFHAAHAVTRFGEMAEAQLPPGVRVIDRVGDEILITGSVPEDIVRTAIGLRDTVAAEPLFPMVRAGIHAGRVVQQHDRYFGGPLNLTSRIAAHARAGQILCTEPIRRDAAHVNQVAFQPLGAVRFKNVAEAVPVFELIVGRENLVRAIDPVCRMQVDIETAPAKLPFAERVYYFCSFECAKAFADTPERYLGIVPSMS